MIAKSTEFVFRVAAVLLSAAGVAHGDVVPIQARNKCPDMRSPCYEIRGPITEKDLALVSVIAERATKNQHRNSFFHLNSKGGDVDAAIQIGRHLRELSAIAAVGATAECLSACVFVLAGATRRAVGSTARIGIHRPYSLRTDIRDYRAAQKEHSRLAITAKTYLEDMNLPTSLYDAMMRVPPENIRILSQHELTSFGLNQIDPAEQELIDTLEARQYGLNKLDYVRRKGEVLVACAHAWSSGQESGNFDEYFSCRERVMRGEPQ
ncbi:MAG: ATP-dependent Clp protease proteolytic subunit [Burkholderiales bacterium]|nr:ATP-dependent Clp protease proteolytic subunit [Burkholderiales bacterium]